MEQLSPREAIQSNSLRRFDINKDSVRPAVKCWDPYVTMKTVGEVDFPCNMVYLDIL